MQLLNQKLAEGTLTLDELDTRIEQWVKTGGKRGLLDPSTLLQEVSLHTVPYRNPSSMGTPVEASTNALDVL